MKIDIISHSDSLGGAARASLRLHRALLKENIDSSLIVKSCTTDQQRVISCSRIGQIYYRGLSYFSSKIGRLQKTRSSIIHSFNFFGSFVFKRIMSRKSDVVNLHWINAETLSIKQISKINKPVVMTLHDMWAFCGAEHLSVDDENSMFRKGYSLNDRNSDYIAGVNLNYLTWKRKQKYWNKPFILVTPSRWLSKCASESKLFRGWEIHTIPNPLDTDMFKPIDKSVARQLLNVDQDKIIIGFGAMGGGQDPNKGFDLLVDALNNLPNPDKYLCVILGQSHGSGTPSNINIDIKYVGHLHDEASLVAFYNALDVMVVPSKQENLPQTATEAQSCGIPVVAFNTTGLKDVVVHKVTGYLAEPFEPVSLARGIEWCVSDRGIDCSLNARKRAVELWAEGVITLQYLNVYEKALDRK
ncbi:glycosyltransferase [Vibrio breoganii]|uniref:glycosyltransferase n=1 Tax=Vibrio breoganii TaxID=553239 RepID=UPI000C82A4DD|nr:glycosyltransferase [Vibrio breoganii]PMM79283.1 hypothetical protein BCT45_16595 [Vibrio breoganii]